jgi:hypothetical protein
MNRSRLPIRDGGLKMRLVSRAGLIIAAVLAMAPASHAQGDMKSIITQHMESRGGFDRVSGLLRYEIMGSISRDGQTLPMHIWWRRPNMLRVDIGHGEGATSTVYDGQMAWTVEPGPWGKEASGMVPGWREMFIRQADFCGPFVYPERNGITVSRDNDLWGPTGYKLLVKRETGQTDQVILDPNTRLTKLETFQVGPPGFEYQVEHKYSRYRRFQGFAFPGRTERFVDGELAEVITIDEVLIGPPVEEALFAMHPADYTGSESPNLVDLNQLSDLRDRFVADAGHIRLVAVLSPTSADSRRGFLDLQNTLNRINDDRVRAYVIWTNILDTDHRQAAAKRTAEFNDPRITFFWDQNHVASASWQMASNTKRAAWNSYYLHGPKASWEASPSAPDYWFQLASGRGAKSTASDADGFTKISELLTSMPEDEKSGNGGNSHR